MTQSNVARLSPAKNAGNDLEIRRAVQKQIHAGDGRCGEIFLLPE